LVAEPIRSHMPKRTADAHFFEPLDQRRIVGEDRPLARLAAVSAADPRDGEDGAIGLALPSNSGTCERA